jgi:hypothetical protein
MDNLIPIVERELASIVRRGPSNARASTAIGRTISPSTVWCILDADAIKPWRCTALQVLLAKLKAKTALSSPALAM